MVSVCQQSLPPPGGYEILTHGRTELALVREALNVGPEDQSLWFYHQYLVGALIEPVGRGTIAPNLEAEERTTYLLRELENINDLPEAYGDLKLLI